ncbi:RagB/SusD family nutrient uptake outer membrane protein [Rufibacter roseolus]|uniref:RagB/SusD family nutrient uptake outer membrane protein n=1 Tax=Rufibacter roseolus TaxID=2817375 RepID=UPI001B30A3EF|nr:RagB/SusD family nutrient uptake outer membrane protein [Rufibacter roseolus]
MKKSFLYRINTVVLAAGIVFSTFSCEDLLEIKPETAIDGATALNSKSAIEAAINAAYVPLKSLPLYGNRLITLPEALADNGRATNKSGRLLNEASNIRGVANHFTHWATSYNAIQRINLVLEAIPGLADPTVSQTGKDAYIGELKFLRALYHFDLVRSYAYIPGAVVDAKNFGGVPVITQTFKSGPDAAAFLPARASLDETYNAIYADLDEAVAKLGAFANAGKASKVAAQALYSRVALYRRDYPKVIEMSTAVIDARGATLTTPANYLAGWTAATNPETIFHVAFQTAAEGNGVNESLQTAFTTLVTRGNRTQTGGFGDLVPTPTLLSDLGITVAGNGTATAAITARSEDVRNLLFEVGTAGRGNPWVEATKFIGKNGAINLDNVPVLRISEMYLNRAEAYANTAGGLVNALADVNTIRTNRGLLPSVAVDQALKNEILLQRRLEFAFEGHRFFDLKRLGMDISKPALGTTVAFTEDVILPAIPTIDVNGNPNLKQNSGY